MLLFWRIRYLDRRDRQFKDRDLWLDTKTLDPVTRAAVELCDEMERPGRGPRMLRYRHLFREKTFSGDEMDGMVHRCGGVNAFCLPDYFEDENGQELTWKQMALALTGDPNAAIFPAGMKKHDIDYVLADKRPVPIDQVSLSPENLSILGYFSRDVREILASSFLREGPGTLKRLGTVFLLQTAVTDEEIRSFVTVFRRLYLQKEPANFLKAVAVFGEVTQGYPLAGWVKGIEGEYRRELDAKPDLAPIAGREKWSFSRKRLIDVFLYTQYAHQPDDKRTRQFEECLAEVGSSRPMLTWLFLGALWQCSLHMHNAGVMIADFYHLYCRFHKVSPSILASVSSSIPGLGMLEKKEDRQARIFREKSEELAMTIWQNSGRPQGGPTQFLLQARAQLSAALEKVDEQGEASQ